MKAGSALTLPRDLKVETTDKEFKIIRVENPAQISMITVQNLQANVQYDTQMVEMNYEAARSTLHSRANMILLSEVVLPDSMQSISQQAVWSLSVP